MTALFRTPHFRTPQFATPHFGGVGAPVPVVTGPSGPGTSGGGRPFNYSEIFFDPPEGFVLPGIDPSLIPKFTFSDDEIATEAAIQAETEALIHPWMERVEKLKEELARLRSEKFRSVDRTLEIKELKVKLALLEKELARKPKETVRIVERTVESFRDIRTESPWAASAPWFASSAIIGLLTAVFAPKGPVQWVGFGTSALLAAIGAVELAAGGERTTIETLAAPTLAPPKGLLPIGQIRIR